MPATATRKLAVILHADVADSTNLVQRDETIAHQRITGAFRRFSSTITTYGGVVHEIRGDALVAEFARASDAVCAAVAFQLANAAHNDALDDDIVPVVRVGLGMGEVVVADHTITGAGVVLAQRVEQLAPLGGVCIQGAAYETVPKRLPLDFESLGDCELKGFAEPVRVYAAALREDATVPPPDPAAVRSSTRRARLRGLVAVLVAGLLVAGGLGAWWWASSYYAARSAAIDLASPERPAIAVLPFENLNADPDQDYFSDGITNDIINDLSRFSNLTVIARNSMFTYKGKPTKVQTVARDLGVRFVLEGSVQRAGDRVRINVQFVDANSGRQLWAERFDKSVTDLFELQDEITQRIVRTLAVRVTEFERRRVLARAEADFNAYDLVLRGRALLSLLTRTENFQARELFRKAIAVDPGYASAHAGLGWTYMNAILYGFSGAPLKALRQSEAHARRAIALDEASVDGHRLLGRVLLNTGKHDLAMLELERAIALNPNDAESHANQGLVFVYTNRVDAAIRTLETALRIDPNMTPEALLHMGMAYYLKARYADAVPWLQRGIARNAENLFLHIVLAAAYAQLDRAQDAAREATIVRRLNPFFTAAQYGGLFTDTQSANHFRDGIRRAGLK